MTNDAIYLPEGHPDMTEAEIEAYRLHCEEEEAIHFGTATRLISCYLCPEGSPRRGVLRSYTGGDRHDPSEVLVLSCGHHIL